MKRRTLIAHVPLLVQALAAAALLAVTAPPALAAETKAPAPDFVLDSNTGKPIKLSGLKGQVVMINFWATWCGPCREEFPLLDSIHKQYKDKGFTLLGVNVEPEKKAADAWLQKKPVSFPILYDVKSDVTNLYKVVVMPSTVFIDKKGFVRVVHRGYKAGDENEYMNNIRMLMREK